MEITIKRSSVLKKAGYVLDYADDFSSDVKELLTIIESINMAWDGADALKYINIMKDKYIPSLNSLGDLLKEYGEYLRNVPEAYSILDETFENKKIDV